MKMAKVSLVVFVSLAMVWPAVGARAGQKDAQVAKAPGEMAPLQIEFPKPKFIGTPGEINSANLEKSSKRAPILAPKGAVNLALNKPVTGSDKEPVSGDFPLITDGDKSADEGSAVEFGKGKQYVQLDLGQKASIYAVAVWHYHSQKRVYHDVVVQVADDPDFISNVKTVFNNDHDNSSGLGVGKDKEYIETNEGRVIDAKGAKARYVRLWSNGNTSSSENHYIEVEVYGKPAK